jgi:hypothetical protein
MVALGKTIRPVGYVGAVVPAIGVSARALCSELCAKWVRE